MTPAKAYMYPLRAARSAPEFVRAIDAVEEALRIHGAPVYVRHEIVHNKYVVEGLKAKGAIFRRRARRGARYGTAGDLFPRMACRRRFWTMPKRANLRDRRHLPAGYQGPSRGRNCIIAKAAKSSSSAMPDIPEVVGTLGAIAKRFYRLVQNSGGSRNLPAKDENHLAYVTQTTLSVDDTHAMVAALTRRFPNIVGPHREDICYATTKPAGGSEARGAGCRCLGSSSALPIRRIRKG